MVFNLTSSEPLCLYSIQSTSRTRSAPPKNKNCAHLVIILLQINFSTPSIFLFSSIYDHAWVDSNILGSSTLLGSPWPFMTTSKQMKTWDNSQLQAMRNVGPRWSEATNNLDIFIPPWSDQGIYLELSNLLYPQTTVVTYRALDIFNRLSTMQNFRDWYLMQ